MFVFLPGTTVLHLLFVVSESNCFIYFIQFCVYSGRINLTFVKLSWLKWKSVLMLVVPRCSPLICLCKSKDCAACLAPSQDPGCVILVASVSLSVSTVLRGSSGSGGQMLGSESGSSSVMWTVRAWGNHFPSFFVSWGIRLGRKDSRIRRPAHRLALPHCSESALAFGICACNGDDE